MTTNSPFQAWTQAWQGLTPSTASSPLQAWTQAWEKFTPSAGSSAFQGWTQALPGASSPAAWPVSAMQALYVELPVEVATRLQRFAAAQVQEQIRLLSEIATPDGTSGAFQKQAGFLQQSSFAWGAELMEIMELYREKLLNPTQQPAGDAPVTYPKAAA